MSDPTGLGMQVAQPAKDGGRERSMRGEAVNSTGLILRHGVVMISRQGFYFTKNVFVLMSLVQ